MLIAPDETLILHHSPVFAKNGERDGLWRLDAPFDKPPVVVARPGGEGILQRGERGWFALSNAFYGHDHFRIRALRFDDVAAVRAQTAWPSEGGPVGDADAWRNLPMYWLSPMLFGGDRIAAMRLSGDGALHPLRFDWAADEAYEYDQAPTVIRSEPSTGEIVVGVSRSNHVVFCDSQTGALNQLIRLEGDAGNVRDIQFHQASETMWVVGYDTLFRYAQRTRKLERSRQVQEPVTYEYDQNQGIRQWVGDFVLQPAHRRVCIARPFSGDVVAVDWESLEPVAVARTGGAPAFLAAFDDLIIARDWRSGEVLRATLA